MLAIFFLVFPRRISGEIIVISGEKSGPEDDAKSLAECPRGAVLVNCEIILGDGNLNHDGVRIENEKFCAAFMGAPKLTTVPESKQFVQVNNS